MRKREFEGVLKNIRPKLLINEGENDEIDNFFLVLAIIYNDLKSLFFFRVLVNDSYRKPETNEISAHAGEYGGLDAYTKKLLISTVVEFLSFIEKNHKVLDSIKFQLLLKKLNPEIKNQWLKLVVPDKESTTILGKFRQIRSNISFHYDHSNSQLRKGFVEIFYSDKRKLPQLKNAHFSLGNDMVTTRFYYADAAVQGYINSLLGNENDSDVIIFLIDMNHTLKALLEIYLSNKTT